jgi:uncharacterized membrane protein YqaE (UPF0057 family)
MFVVKLHNISLRVGCNKPSVTLPASQIYLRSPSRPVHPQYTRNITKHKICANTMPSSTVRTPTPIALVQALTCYQSTIFLYFLAIWLPFVPVFIRRGCSADLLINIMLDILGWIPGVIHSWYIISKTEKHPDSMGRPDGRRY